MALAAGGVLAFAGSAAAAPLPGRSTAARPAGQADVVALRALDAALSQRGTRYRSGGSGPGGFDCSGLVQWSYRQAGLYLPRTAAAQSRVGTRVSLSQIRPGDLIFYSYGGGVGHVAMAAGDGMLIESSQSGHPVAKRRIYTRGLAVIRRVAEPPPTATAPAPPAVRNGGAGTPWRSGAPSRVW
ncbi:MAG TPA: C40 family peptidase [Pseudonocardiaceae bacterium]|nr:C40 family peptidase [Pseudonocardiaceae bacterium]